MPLHRRASLACLGLGAALVLTCAAPPAIAAPSAPGSVNIPIQNFAFMPMTVTIPVGGSVTWTNMDGEIHTVVSTDGAFRSGGLDQGDSFTFKFPKAGVYSYICSIHPKMKATVVVK